MKSPQADPLLSLNVSRETIGRLEALVGLMRKLNPAINLVAKSTLDDAWTRHIVDSAQIYSLAPQKTRLWADLGSGGGLPGLVIACLAAQLQPEMVVALVESDQRKAAFLSHVNQVLALNCRIIVDRIERVLPLKADAISARALAPLEKLCAYADRHIDNGGIALFQKGVNYASEVELAKKNWKFSLEIHPSITESAAVVLKLAGLSHV
ncbi:MAG: 16S rRNA (guanine(527)-N(7))-methyltransferase RsmG [Methylophilaceae bacterium]|nr:16S rRNA (guanine(527)-N(7))-methyltransferase RsmG [Methylophilaceae bacterium]